MQPEASWTAKLTRGVLVGAGLCAAAVAPGQSSKALQDFGAVFPGQVNTMKEAGGVLYVGGNFSQAYKPAGPFLIVDKTSATPQGFPTVTGGDVNAIARDGAGGWFLGGSFTTVAGYPRAGLAHILADGRLSDWNPGVSGGAVLALQPAGVWVYVGGSFSVVGGAGRSRLARVSVATGAVDAVFNPTADNTVRDLDLGGGVLYAAGDFTSLNAGATPRGRLAAFDAVTGALDSAWNPNADGVVRAVRSNLAGTGVYAGGDFANVGGAAHARLAIVQPAGAGNPGNSLGWAPSVDNNVYAVVELGGRLYFAGTFSLVNAATRNKLAAVSAFPASAVLTAWNPDPLAVWIFALEGDGTTIYAGGDLSLIDTSGAATPRRGVAALPAGGTGLPATGFDPSIALIDANDAVVALAVDGGRLALGGSFDGYDLRDRGRLAAFDVGTGSLAGWAPVVDNGSVETLDVFGASTVYVGGSFTTVTGGTARGGLAAFDTTGGLLGWAPTLSGSTATAFSLIVDGATPDVYVGGDFTSPRTDLAKFSGVTGALDTGFNPGAPNGTPPVRVNALELAGSFLYVGGTYTTIGAASRLRLGVVNSASGALDPWNPAANGEVRDLGLGTTQAYAVGNFGTVGGSTRNFGAATALADGTATGQPPNAWNPTPSTIADAVQPLPNGDVALAGNFSTLLGTVARSRFASVDAGAGTPRPWNPNASGGNGTALALGTKRLYAGGSFLQVGGQKRYGLAAFCLAAQPNSLTATPTANNSVSLSWLGTAPSHHVYRSTRTGGPYTLLGTVAGTTAIDTAAQGGVPYFYIVKGLDACVSDPSNEASATAQGSCNSAPEFEGVAGAAASAAPLCGTTLVWAPSIAQCGTGVHHSIYRSTNPAFTPDVSNRLAAGVAGTKYTDTSGLVGGTTYYYAVRAQHDSNGQEDQNLIRLAFVAPGCTLTAPEPVHVFTVTSRDAENVLDWLRPTLNYSQTVVRACGPGFPACASQYPQSPSDGGPVVTVGGPASQPFKFTHAPLTNGSSYSYAAFALDGAGTEATPAFSFGRPDSQTLFPKWGFGSGASALTPVGVVPGNRYLAVSNDRVVHALGAGTSAAASGNWPSGWTPFSMNGPAQARPTIVTLGGTPVAFVSSQDGRLYALDANTGAQIWSPGVLGASIQASASVRVGAPNLVFVGTRDLAGSRMFALNHDTQSVAWTFAADESARPLGIISGQPALDLATSRLYFGSRAKGGGSPHTVWCLPFGGGPAVWTRDLEDVDAAVALLNGRLYVGTTNGKVYALNKADGTNAWSAAFDTGTGQPIQDLLFVASVDATRWRVYFTAGGRVFGLEETAATAAPVPFWPAGGIAIANASAPLVRLPRVYVGGANSRVYSLDGNSPTPPAPDQVVVGDPLAPKVLGRPTFDVTGNLLLVGSDQGVVYSVAQFP